MTEANPEVAAKQIWEHNRMPGHQVRVMGVVEGYVVARKKGCGPFLQHINDFKKNFTRIK